MLHTGIKGIRGIQKHYLYEALSLGVGIRKLSRLTGISYTIVRNDHALLRQSTHVDKVRVLAERLMSSILQ